MSLDLTLRTKAGADVRGTPGASGQVIVCNADGTPRPVTLSGDATVDADGVVTLANSAGLGALFAAGLGASDSYDKTTAGAQDLVAADADARVALIVATVTEEFADGDGGQTEFSIGEEDAATKFSDGAEFAGAQAGDVFVFAGSVTAAKKLIVTGTAATGTGTGALSVAALILPAAA